MKPLILLAFAFFVSGCETVNYVKSEVTGTAKPEGGIQDSVPASRTYSASAQAVRRATLQVLDEQGYVYEENSSTGTIKTEPKLLTDTSKFIFMGATYATKLFIKLDGATVTYRAKFDKKSNVTMGEQNAEFPEKEAELRKEFFAALDGKLSTPGSTPASSVSSGTKAAAPSAVKAEPSSQTTTVQQIQRRLSELGYQPGPADGKMGKSTVDALKKFQHDNNLAKTGKADNETITKLQQRKDAKAEHPVSPSTQSTEPPQKSVPIKVRSVTDL